MTVLSGLTVAAAGNSASTKPFTIIIDPGHGGHDHGAPGAKSSEKNINLAVATKLGNLLSEQMPDAKVIFTRSNDSFISLQGRCDKANKSKGDIFVSIHTNSVDANSPRRSTVSGASVYTLGLQRTETNLDVAMRENSVMKLEDDYTETYCGFDPQAAESYIIFELAQTAHIENSLKLADAIQRELCSTASRKDLGVRQAPFWVLVRTSMPAVLVELDFICNPTEEEFLTSEEGSEKLAQAIYDGIARYRGVAPSKSKTSMRRKHRTKVEKSDEDEQKEKISESVVTDRNDEIIYKVQFLTSARELAADDPRLEGIEDPAFYREGRVWKYTSGGATTLREAKEKLQEIKKRYNDAFIIKTRNGVRIN